MLKINQVAFIKSATKESEWPENPAAIEYCFLGRSNVGKSSFLNALCNNKKLAKTSQTPGKTQLLNFFTINNGDLFFVDVPGYGFSKVSKTIKEQFINMIEHYLTRRKSLKGVFLLLDIRLLPSVEDFEMMKYLQFYFNDIWIVLTKSDKLSYSQIKKQSTEIKACFPNLATEQFFVVSSKNKTGFEPILAML